MTFRLGHGRTRSAAQLKALGNGAVPQQGALALRQLLKSSALTSTNSPSLTGG
jgi:hypothetical protein